MKQKSIIITLILTLILSFNSCKSEKNKDLPTKVEKHKKVVSDNNCPDHLLKNKSNNIQISVLLDLSDRISDEKYPNPSMSYTKRDLGYINTIANSFIHHIKKKRLVLMNDKIQLYFEPAPMDASINEKSKILKTFFNKNLKRKDIEKMEEDYKIIPSEIYSLAQNDGKYVGSNIWRFFKDKVKRYSIDKCNRNILVILTDGYMYHEDTKLKEKNLTSYITPSQLRKYGLNNSKWKNTIEENNFGFIPATANLNDLEVLVLGIVNHDKKRNPYGKDIMVKYWKDWFKAMGVKKYEVLGAELPSNMQSSISDFILKN